MAPLTTKDITENPADRDELLAKGGKLQVPFLVDEAHGVAMYESLDIIGYLQKTYAGEQDIRS